MRARARARQCQFPDARRILLKVTRDRRAPDIHRRFLRYPWHRFPIQSSWNPATDRFDDSSIYRRQLFQENEATTRSVNRQYRVNRYRFSAFFCDSILLDDQLYANFESQYRSKIARVRRAFGQNILVIERGWLDIGMGESLIRNESKVAKLHR